MSEEAASGVQFIHCERCGKTERTSSAPTHDDEISAFRKAHPTCRVETFEATGRATASTIWNDPMAIRRLEVRSEHGLAVAIGSRSLLDEPLSWKIDRQATEEHTEVELDRGLFWGAVDRAIHPAHVRHRALDEWASQIEHHVRNTPAADIILLEDDPACGNATYACLTLTSRSRLEANLRSFGFDREIEQKLEELFDEELFPPLRVRRRLDTVDEANEEAPAHPQPAALTR